MGDTAFRLDRLRRQAGQRIGSHGAAVRPEGPECAAADRHESTPAPIPPLPEPPPPATSAVSPVASPGSGGWLRERLRSPGSARGGQPRGRGGITETELAARLGGIRTAAGLIVVDHHLPRGSRQDPDLPPEWPDALGCFGHTGTPVFLDTETTGLAGGSGTLVFLLALARPLGTGLHLRQWLLTRFAGETSLLAAATEFLDGGGTVVSYNGKSFDRPLISTRLRLCGLPDPFIDLPHLDLLHPVRAAFSDRWSNCRLQTAERHLLDLTRSQDLPGSEAPVTWFEWIRHGRMERLPAVLRHNRQDVISLAALLPALARVYRDPESHAANAGGVARRLHRQRRNEARPC